MTTVGDAGARFWGVAAGLSGALAMVFAAWSSHGLARTVPPDQLAAAIEMARVANLHHLLHSLALLGVSLWVRQGANGWVHLAGVLFLLGIVGFAGGILGVRVLAGIHTGPLVVFTPAGGLCLILGWVALAIGAWRGQRSGSR